MKDRVVRSVHDDRVSILNHTVVPFLTEMLEADTVTDTDRSRARSIATDCGTWFGGVAVTTDRIDTVAFDQLVLWIVEDADGRGGAGKSTEPVQAPA